MTIGALSRAKRIFAAPTIAEANARIRELEAELADTERRAVKRERDGDRRAIEEAQRDQALEVMMDFSGVGAASERHSIDVDEETNHLTAGQRTAIARFRRMAQSGDKYVRLAGEVLLAGCLRRGELDQPLHAGTIAQGRAAASACSSGQVRI